jgi:sugar-specific transcriptional regulator TrmB
MINNIEAQLATPELSEREVKLYLALLEIGESTVKDLANRTGIKRPTVYLTLESLHQKGLVSIIEEEKIKHYSAQDPENLREFFAEKIRVLNQTMSELKFLSKRVSKKPAIRFFSGIEGARSAYMETLEEPPGTIFYSAGSLANASKILGEDWANNYLKTRTKKKIKAKAILADEPFARELEAKNKEQIRETLLIDPDSFPETNELLCFGDKIGLASYKDQPLGIIIENKEFAQIFKNIFELAWKKQKK